MTEVINGQGLDAGGLCVMESEYCMQQAVLFPYGFVGGRVRDKILLYKEKRIRRRG